MTDIFETAAGKMVGKVATNKTVKLFDVGKKDNAKMLRPQRKLKGDVIGRTTLKQDGNLLVTKSSKASRDFSHDPCCGDC